MSNSLVLREPALFLLANRRPFGRRFQRGLFFGSTAREDASHGLAFGEGYFLPGGKDRV